MASLPVILVAVDGSTQSMDTVTYLGRFLSPTHVKIDLVHVLPKVPEPFLDLGASDGLAVSYDQEIDAWKDGRSAAIHDFMGKARARLAGAGFPPGNVSVNVAPCQVGIARDIINMSLLDYAAVVIGRRGSGTLPAAVPGSVASKLADTIAHIPLCMVSGQPEATTVLVAFDRSRGIRRGLEQMEPLMSRSLHEISLCHIVRPLSVYQPAGATYFTKKNESFWLDENSRQIIPAMVEAKQHLSRAGFNPDQFRTAILKEQASRADSLCKEADAAGAGTIIVGRRGTTTVDMFAMGRVTRKIYYLSSTDRAIWIV